MNTGSSCLLNRFLDYAKYANISLGIRTVQYTDFNASVFHTGTTSRSSTVLEYSVLGYSTLEE
jgi:hypothetical protein